MSITVNPRPIIVADVSGNVSPAGYEALTTCPYLHLRHRRAAIDMLTEPYKFMVDVAIVRDIPERSLAAFSVDSHPNGSYKITILISDSVSDTIAMLKRTSPHLYDVLAKLMGVV